MKKIIIIGAGPIGLITAYQLYKNNFRNITVIEKRAEYTRHQIISFGEEILFDDELLPKKVCDKLKSIICYIKDTSTDTKAECFTKSFDKDWESGKTKFSEKSKIFLNTVSISIYDIEELMYNYITTETNIKIIKPSKEILSEKDVCTFTITINNKYIKVEELNKKFEYDILIGADGTNGNIRNKFFSTHVKYFNVPEKYAILNIFCCQINNKVPHKNEKYANEEKSKEQQFRTRVFRNRKGWITVAINLTKKEYLEFKETRSSLNTILKHVWKTYNLKKTPQEQLISQCSFKIKPYYVTKPYLKRGNKQIFLVGDSQMTTHFFTGTGFVWGTQNIKTLVKFLKNNDKKEYNNRINQKIDEAKKIFKSAYNYL